MNLQEALRRIHRLARAAVLLALAAIASSVLVVFVAYCFGLSRYAEPLLLMAMLGFCLGVPAGILWIASWILQGLAEPKTVATPTRLSRRSRRLHYWQHLANWPASGTTNRV